MKIEKLFPTIFASDFLDIDNQAMAGFCRWTVDGKNQSRVAGDSKYQSDFNPSDPFVKDLLEQITLRVKVFLSEYELTEHEVELQRSWLNINNCREIDRPHIHRECFATAVYYVEGSGTSDGGFLEMINPADRYPYNIPLGSIKNYNYTNSETFRILPETGKLVIFPAWVEHYVTPNFTGKDRISMVFNYKLNFDKQHFRKEIF